jgi:hypothetical protein
MDPNAEEECTKCQQQGMQYSKSMKKRKPRGQVRPLLQSLFLHALHNSYAQTSTNARTRTQTVTLFHANKIQHQQQRICMSCTGMIGNVPTDVATAKANVPGGGGGGGGGGNGGGGGGGGKQANGHGNGNGGGGGGGKKKKAKNPNHVTPKDLAPPVCYVCQKRHEFGKCVLRLKENGGMQR